MGHPGQTIRNPLEAPQNAPLLKDPRSKLVSTTCQDAESPEPGRSLPNRRGSRSTNLSCPGNERGRRNPVSLDPLSAGGPLLSLLLLLEKVPLMFGLCGAPCCASDCQPRRTQIFLRFGEEEDGVGYGIRHLFKRSKSQCRGSARKSITGQVVAGIVLLTSRTTVGRCLGRGLGPFSPCEESTRRDTDRDEGSIVRASIEGGWLARQPLSGKVIEGDLLDET